MKRIKCMPSILRVKLSLLLCTVLAISLVPFSPAYALSWEPPTPWNGRVFLYCPEKSIYQSEDFTFTIDVWDVGSSDEGMRIDISLTDQSGGGYVWNDIDPRYHLQVGTGFGHAYKFTVGSEVLSQLLPGVVTITTHLEYYNGQTGA